MKRNTLFLRFSLAISLAAHPLAHAQELSALTLPDAPTAQASVSQSSSSSAQSSSSSAQGAPTTPQADATGKPAQHGDDDQLKQEEKQRLLGIVPAFNTVQGGEAAALRPSQKFDLWYHSAIDPFTFAVAAIDAGIEQGNNTYPEYNQGIEGYAKRFGASYADSVDGNFWGNAVLPSLLHQDPRYFRLGHGTFKRRLVYSLISTVRCKGDNGKWQPSYSNIGGNLIGGAISNLYYPASDRGVGLTLERGFTVTAEGALGSIAFEFYPDVISHFKRRHHQDAGPAVPAAPPTANPH